MPCPKDLKRLAIRSWVSISRECSHSVSGFSQYAGYGSRTAIEVRYKAIQVLCTFNQSLIGIAIVPDPQQDSQITCVLRLSIRKHGQVDILELHQFCGVDILFAEIEVGQFNMLVSAKTLRDEVMKADSLSCRLPGRYDGLFVCGNDEECQTSAQENQHGQSV